MSRLPARLLVDLILRSAASQGGFAAILARGDDHGGAILLQCCERGQPGPLYERGFDGHWAPVGPASESALEQQDAYIARRRTIDPDLWVIELDIVQSSRFIANLNAAG